MNPRRRTLLGFAALACAPAALAAEAKDVEKKRKPDLGDAAEGSYFGDVISDSKGSSRSDVAVTVTRIAVNRVRVTTDYPRLPTVEVQLTAAMGKILQARGDTVFLLDGSAKPAKLDLSFHNEVSWSGVRR